MVGITDVTCCVTKSSFLFPADWAKDIFIGMVRVLDHVFEKARLVDVTPRRHTFASLAGDLCCSEPTTATFRPVRRATLHPYRRGVQDDCRPGSRRNGGRPRRHRVNACAERVAEPPGSQPQSLSASCTRTGAYRASRRRVHIRVNGRHGLAVRAAARSSCSNASAN